MEPDDFSPDEHQQWETIKAGCKRIAWEDYTQRFGEHLFA